MSILRGVYAESMRNAHNILIDQPHHYSPQHVVQSRQTPQNVVLAHNQLTITRTKSDKSVDIQGKDSYIVSITQTNETK